MQDWINIAFGILLGILIAYIFLPKKILMVATDVAALSELE